MLGVPESWDRLVWRTYDDASFTLFYLCEGRMAGVNAVNRARDIGPSRRLIERGAAPDPEALSDPGLSLKKILKAAE